MSDEQKSSGVVTKRVSTSMHVPCNGNKSKGEKISVVIEDAMELNHHQEYLGRN